MVPGRHPNRENEYVVGYPGLGLRGDATLINMNLRVICIKIEFNAI